MKKKPAPKPPTRKKFRSPPTRHRQLLDRKVLTMELPNFKAGLADRHDPDQSGHRWLSGHAPANFRVNLHLEREDPWLWIGVDDDPNNGSDGSGRICFAIIGGETLRQVAEDVLRYYPGKNGGGR